MTALRVAHRSVVCALLALTVSGCAFGNRHVQLLPPNPILTEPPKSVSLHLQSLTDERFAPERVGHVVNLFSMQTGRILATQAIGDWIQRGLADAFQAAGYTLTDDAATAPLSIEGEIIEVDCGSFFAYQGTVRLAIRVRRSGAVLIDRLYTGHETGDVTWWLARTADYEEVLQGALQSAAAQIVYDVNQLKRSP